MTVIEAWSNKTSSWKEVKAQHRAKMIWCAKITDVIDILESIGAPSPDHIGAAHLNWIGQTHSAGSSNVIKGSVTLTMDGSVSFYANKRPIFPDQDIGLEEWRPRLSAKTPDQIRSVAKEWLKLFLPVWESQ